MISNTINNSLNSEEQKFPKTINNLTEELIYQACLIKIKQCLQKAELFYGEYVTNDGNIKYEKCHIIGKMFAFDYINDKLYFKAIEINLSKRETDIIGKAISKQHDLISDIEKNPELIDILEILIRNEVYPSPVARENQTEIKS